MTVVMTGRDQAALERARNAVDEDAHTRAVAVPMDVTDAESIDAAYRIVRERVGSVDVLVNNAAVLLFDNEDVLSIPASAYRQTFETNVFGVIDVCRTFGTRNGTPTIWPCRERLIASRAARDDVHLRAGVFDVEGGAERLHTYSRQHLPRRRRPRQRRGPRMGSHRRAIDGTAFRRLTPEAFRGWLAALPDAGPSGRSYLITNSANELAGCESVSLAPGPSAAASRAPAPSRGRTRGLQFFRRRCRFGLP